MSSSNCSGLRKKLPSLNKLEQRALDDCLNLLDETVEELKTTVADLSQTTIGSKRYHDSQTFLSDNHDKEGPMRPLTLTR